MYSQNLDLMSNKKTKKVKRKKDQSVAFRFEKEITEIIDKIHEETEVSKTNIVAAALFHLSKLSSNKLRDVLKDYLVKNL